MKKLVMSIVMIVALMGAVITAPVQAGVSGSDIDCREVANHVPEWSNARVNIKEKKVVSAAHMRGQVDPIPEVWGDEEDARVVRRHCQQTAKLTLTVYREGKKVTTLRLRGKSDPNSGRLNLTGKKSGKMAPLPEGTTKFKVKLKYRVTDPDQQVAKSSRTKTGTVKKTVKTKTIQIT